MALMTKIWKTVVLALAGLLLSFACVFPSYGEGGYEKNAEGGKWVELPICQAEGGLACGTGTERVWYYQKPDGGLASGWLSEGGRWYFLNPAEGTEKGKMMTGWQWIDGRCYYLAETTDLGHPQGAMYAGERTPDGYNVGVSGAWLADGAEVHIPGKGIASAGTGIGTVKLKSGGTGNRTGGSSGGSSGGAGGSFEEEIKDHFPENEPESGEKGEGDDVLWEEEGDQSEEKATPSEARKVLWEVSFADEADPNRKIFREQRGTDPEGTELTVDFPETIVGNDGREYRSLERSPKRIVLSGTGIQKYVVLFRGSDVSGGEQEEDETRRRLETWIETAKAADQEITGEEAEEWQVITNSQEESRERLVNLVSMVSDGTRHEVYLIGRNHTPSAVIIGQEFADAVSVSELQMDELWCQGDRYCIIRVGFQRTWKEETCVHDMETKEYAAAECTLDGYERSSCKRCGYEETVFFPAAGHRDGDGDGSCDICCSNIDEEGAAGAIIYREGDVQIRYLGGQPYRFRCIDEDYGDDRDNRRYAALFLCESVIRSDVDTAGQAKRKMNFGDNNNYKTSNVRKWLREKAEGTFDDLSFVYTGVNTAYQGSTGEGEYEQFAFDSLVECEKPFQMMEDKMFILSVEEAVKYRDFLWKFNGSAQNNPMTQYSPYSRGYYLRTPQYEGGESFQYGTGIYTVDLSGGSIHPTDVSDTSIGIRPAYILAQGRELIE